MFNKNSGLCRLHTSRIKRDGVDNERLLLKIYAQLPTVDVYGYDYMSCSQVCLRVNGHLAVSI